MPVSSLHPGFQVRQDRITLVFVHLMDDRLGQLAQDRARQTVFDAHRDARATVLRLVGPDEGAGDAALVFVDDARVFDELGPLRLAFEAHAGHLVDPLVAVTAVGQRLHVIDLQQTGPDLREVVRLRHEGENLLQWSVDKDGFFDFSHRLFLLSMQKNAAISDSSLAKRWLQTGYKVNICRSEA